MFSFIAFLKKSYTRLLIFLPLVVGLLITPITANALYPSDPSSVDVLKEDYRGKDLQNTEYVKYDLSSQDLSEVNLQGAYMSVTTAKNSSFKGANMKDLIAYATRFDNADLSDAETEYDEPANDWSDSEDEEYDSWDALNGQEQLANVLKTMGETGITREEVNRLWWGDSDDLPSCHRSSMACP